MKHHKLMLAIALTAGIAILYGHFALDLQVSVANNIMIVGTTPFVTRTQAALNFLGGCTPSTLDTTSQLIHVIVEFNKSGVVKELGVFAVSNTVAFAPGHSQSAQIFWYAGSIIHDARHVWQYQNGLNTKSWDAKTLAEREATEADARAFSLLALPKCVEHIPEAAQNEVNKMIEYIANNRCDYCRVNWIDANW